MNYPTPFACKGVLVVNSLGKEVCQCVGTLEAKDVSDALNYWANKPKEVTDGAPKQPIPTRQMRGVCNKCATIHSTVCIGQICDADSGCGGIIQDYDDKPKQAPPPIANRATTDEIASKYYASGRKLKIECWLKTLGDWFCPAMPEYDPGFTADLPWRIKPVKEHQVWHVFRDHTGGLEVAQVESEWHDILSKNPGWKLVGTLEGEVNA